MSPIVILIISIVLVVAGILVCKLHAFLALLLAALVAAFLTSGEALDTYALDEAETEFERLFGQRPGELRLAREAARDAARAKQPTRRLSSSHSRAQFRPPAIS